MTHEKQTAIHAIDAKKDLICQVSDYIWSHPELSLGETEAAACYCRILEEEGFHVEKGICGIPTAFAASFGSGSPRIGILAEYDALSGLSQEAGATEPREIVPGGNGHGCGHNLLGAGSFGAALGVKAYLEESGRKGTVILYGCPGEEGGASKAFMARDGLWKSLDAAFSWHPDEANEVRTGSTNSCIQIQYKYTGVASHAAGNPEQGRSALDAVELMNIGVQFLREHMSDGARVHYAITDAGGISPNVVQPRASVLYMIRANRVAEAVQLQARVDRIAEGAALMTDTALERKFIDGMADTVSCHTLEKILYHNFREIGIPEHTPEELEFTDRLAKTYDADRHIPGAGAENDAALREAVQALMEKNGRAMNDFLCPLYQGEAFHPGSTDVGDVSWLTPTAQIHVAAWPNGCPGHSWQSVSCAGASVGKKAAVHAAKVLAASVVDLFETPDILREARAEFEKKTAAGYVCPIPADAVLTVPDL